MAKSIADESIVVSSNSTARVQEMHILIGHILCDLIEVGLNLKKWHELKENLREI